MMETPELRSLLSEHPFLRGLSSEHVDVLAAQASLMDFADRDFLLREGEPADCFYLLRDGQVLLSIARGARHDVRMQLLREGDLVGWSWLEAPYRWRCDGRSVGITRAIAIEAQPIREAMARDIELRDALHERFLPALLLRLRLARAQLIEIQLGALP